MTFDDLAIGQSVFLDANTFVYHFAPDPALGPACRGLLRRVENGEFQGFTSTHILSEAAHRLMTIEASAKFGWPFAGIVYRLQSHPAEVQQLTSPKTAVDRILNSRIQVLTVAPSLLSAATTVSQQTGLLTNDALLVAVMQANGLSDLASNDADFDRVTGLSRYAPA